MLAAALLEVGGEVLVGVAPLLGAEHPDLLAAQLIAQRLKGRDLIHHPHHALAAAAVGAVGKLAPVLIDPSMGGDRLPGRVVGQLRRAGRTGRSARARRAPAGAPCCWSGTRAPPAGGSARGGSGWCRRPSASAARCAGTSGPRTCTRRPDPAACARRTTGKITSLTFPSGLATDASATRNSSFSLPATRLNSPISSSLTFFSAFAPILCTVEISRSTSVSVISRSRAYSSAASSVSRSARG